nr:maf-like protein Moth_0535 isoform X2 [Equus caballus]
MVLCPVIRKLLHKRVVLASASPRRQEILRQAGLRFEVVPSRFKEMLPKALFPSPPAYAVETAKQKALEVARRMHQKDLRAPDVVIGADTIVAVGGLILEKPVDKQDAYSMLSRLSGKEHSVFTGVAIVHCCSRGFCPSRRPSGHRRVGILRGDEGAVLGAVGGPAVGVHRQRGAHGQSRGLRDPGAGRHAGGAGARGLPQRRGLPPEPLLQEAGRALLPLGPRGPPPGSEPPGPRRPGRGRGRTNTGCGPRGGRFQQDGAQPAPVPHGPAGTRRQLQSFKGTCANVLGQP